ncbi:MAG: helix-turn-helix domain-containing protein [Elusimicrobiota bacterium]|nr:helix-turn-helix domain-containing protein [Elusimicrobiota bacterium]
MNDKRFLSTTQVAEMLGISRVAVFKKIQKGEIRAIKIGRNYAIEAEDVTGENLNDAEKKQITAAVDRTVAEYGEVLKKLGRKRDDENQKSHN